MRAKLTKIHKRQPMRILYWTELFWPHIGGIEVFSLHLIPALQQRGYEIEMVTSHNQSPLPDHDRHQGIPIHRFHFLTSLNNRDLKQLAQAQQQLATFKREFKPDIVHLQLSGPSAFFHQRTASAHHAPTLLTIHSLPPGFSQNDQVLMQTIGAAEWVTTVSGNMLTDLRQCVPAIKSRSSVVYNGLSYPPQPPTDLDFQQPNIFCIGRLVKWKGFDLVLIALPHLLKDFPTLHLTIVGNGPERDSLEQQAHELGIADSVTFTGWIAPEQIPEQLATSTLVVIPSRVTGGETLPVVAMQAAHMARPIIASRLVGIPEIVKHEVTGFLIEPEDIKALTRSIQHVLNNPRKAIAMGQRGRDIVQQRFSIDQCADAYDQLYQGLQRKASASDSTLVKAPFQRIIINYFEVTYAMTVTPPLTNPRHPRVSVIIPTYNCADYLVQALESVFSQSYQAYEVIIIDDGSTDHLSQVLKPYTPRIRFYEQPNGGPSAARNHGLAMAKGDFVAFLDGDDVFLPNKLIEQVGILEAKDTLGFVHSGWHLIDQTGFRLSSKTPWNHSSQLNLKTWLAFHPVFLGAALFRRHWLERVGGFNEELPQAEDVELFLRLAQHNCPAEWLPMITIEYRQRPSSLTHRTRERVHFVNKVFRDFFAQTNLSPDIQSLEPTVRVHVLMWCVQQLFIQNYTHEIISYLKESLAFLPSSHLEILKRWIATLFLESKGKEGSGKIIRAYWPVFREALEVDETRWETLENQLNWLIETESQIRKARVSHVH